MREKWCFHQPKYACDREYGELYACSPWSGLRDFAYDYVVSVQPKRVVELGTHFGSSAFAFLQAAADCHLDLELTVADTWEGDLFTGADYRREDVRSVFSEVLRSCYPDQNVRVRKMTFDEAAELDEGGIGLLHIDGSHRYEDVRHDYLRWKDLVSEDGAVFLHDTAPDLFGEQVLGSHLFWRELQAEEPYTLELPVSGGLGIVCRRKELWTFLKDILSCGRYEQNALQTDMQNRSSHTLKQIQAFPVIFPGQFLLFSFRAYDRFHIYNTGKIAAGEHIFRMYIIAADAVEQSSQHPKMVIVQACFFTSLQSFSDQRTDKSIALFPDDFRSQGTV